jgi:hypothetical protein
MRAARTAYEELLRNTPAASQASLARLGARYGLAPALAHE